MIALSLSGWHGTEFFILAVAGMLALLGIATMVFQQQKLFSSPVVLLLLAAISCVVVAAAGGHANAAAADASCARQAAADLRSRGSSPLSVACNGGGARAVATFQGKDGCSYTYDLIEMDGHYSLELSTIQQQSCQGQ